MTTVRAAPAFFRAYEKADRETRALIIQEIETVLRAMARMPATWKRRYNPLKGTRDTVHEVDVGGGPRLGFAWSDGVMTILDFGPHDPVLKRLQTMDVSDAVARAKPWERFGLPPLADEPGPVQLRWHEAQPAWAFALDEAQLSVTDEIVSAIEDALLSSRRTSHLLVAGPGTGKTVVLSEIVRRLSSVSETAESWDVRLVGSDLMHEYLRSATGWETSGFRAAGLEGSCDVRLVDDPESWNLLSSALMRDGTEDIAVVVAVDPHQLDDRITDDEFDTLIASAGAKVHYITNCYRQSSQTGEATLHAAEALTVATPYSNPGMARAFREGRRQLDAAGTDLTFSRHDGSRQTVPVNDAAALEDLIRRTDEYHRQREDGWYTTLIVHDGALPVPYRRLASRPGVLCWPWESAQELRGPEFSHVVVVLPEERLRALSGVVTGLERYETIRRFRIPFSRARDSLVIVTT